VALYDQVSLGRQTCQVTLKKQATFSSLPIMVYLADDYSKSQMIGIGITFIIIPIIAISLRLWAKSIGRRGIHLDDYLIIVAAVSSSKFRLHLIDSNISNRLLQSAVTLFNSLVGIFFWLDLKLKFCALFG
jgi:hypothetical protein